MKLAGQFTSLLLLTAYCLSVEAKTELKKVFEQKEVATLVGPTGRPLSVGMQNTYFTFGTTVFRVPNKKIDDLRGNVKAVKEGRHTHVLAAYDNALFTLVSDAEGGDSVLQLSTNEGRSFKAIDTDLRECLSVGKEQFCGPLYGASGIVKSGNILYYDGGGWPNLFASADLGKTWHVVNGGINTNAASNALLFKVEPNLIIQSMDVNDTGEFKKYELDRTGLKLKNPAGTEGKDLMDRDQLSHRQAYSFSQIPGTAKFVAAMEEGIAVGTVDRMDFVVDNLKALMTKSLVLADEKTILVIGNPKVGGVPAFIVSRDKGLTWQDLSAEMHAAIKKLENVDMENVRVRDIKLGPNNKIYTLLVFDQGGEFSTGKGILAEMRFE